MKESILFPISVDNNNFTTEIVKKSLSELINQEYDIYFLIADSLQVYNKSKQALTDEKTLKLIFSNFRNQNNYFKERTVWLNKLKRDFDIEHSRSNWVYYKSEKFLDHIYYGIYKSILIFYNINRLFKTEMEQAAVKHILKFKNENFDRREIALNVLYIIEEIAFNIRIKYTHKIVKEFYIGSFHLPLIYFFQNKYDLKIQDILPDFTSKKNEFYEGIIINNMFTEWSKITHANKGS